MKAAAEAAAKAKKAADAKEDDDAMNEAIAEAVLFLAPVACFVGSRAGRRGAPGRRALVRELHHDRGLAHEGEHEDDAHAQQRRRRLREAAAHC